MDFVSLSKSRHFLDARPVRVPVFDRPRLAAELVCLVPEQKETRRNQEICDELYVVIEGSGTLRSGSTVQDLEASDAVVVPPGVERTLTNTGTTPLTVLVALSPKPSFANQSSPRRNAPRREAEAGEEAAEAEATEQAGFDESRSGPSIGRPKRVEAPAMSDDRRGAPRGGFGPMRRDTFNNHPSRRDDDRPAERSGAHVRSPRAALRRTARSSTATTGPAARARLTARRGVHARSALEPRGQATRRGPRSTATTGLRTPCVRPTAPHGPRTAHAPRTAAAGLRSVLDPTTRRPATARAPRSTATTVRARHARRTAAAATDVPPAAGPTATRRRTHGPSACQAPSPAPRRRSSACAITARMQNHASAGRQARLVATPGPRAHAAVPRGRVAHRSAAKRGRSR